MDNSVVILSSGMRTFAHLERLRQRARLSVNNMIGQQGGLLAITYTTYRRWVRYLNEGEIQRMQGNNVILRSSPRNSVLLQMCVAIPVLEEALDAQVLPIDPQRKAFRKQVRIQLMLMRKRMRDILKNTQVLDYQHLAQMELERRQVEITNALAMKGFGANGNT